jgi:hypothetical protein
VPDDAALNSSILIQGSMDTQRIGRDRAPEPAIGERFKFGTM